MFFFRLLFPIKIFSSISYCVKCKHLQYFGIYSSPGTKLHMAKTFVWNMWCIRFLNWFWIDMSHRRTFLENGKNWYSDHMLLTGPGNHRSLKVSLGFLLYTTRCRTPKILRIKEFTRLRNWVKFHQNNKNAPKSWTTFKWGFYEKLTEGFHFFLQNC